ncbi:MULTISPECIES: PAS domain S-box protein [Aerosakkonema]|uniref:PAS domain S-box protein n=1 Tax=Aerosakkonema TaxID=1246629 RepID=UPI0035B7013A
MELIGKQKILIVDDWPNHLQFLCIFLQAQGFQIFMAESGETALKQIETILPDLILLDVMMPEMDGFETFQALKNKPESQDIPVIFMTGLSDRVHKVNTLTLGAVDYITKPFVNEEVLARINIHLKLRAIARQLQEKNELLEQEIRDRRQIEADLLESKSRFDQMASSIRECFWIGDAEISELLYVSPAYEEIWGRSCQSIYERKISWLDAVHPEDREQIRNAWERVFQGEASEQEYRVIRPDGSIVWVLDRTFPVRNWAGEIFRLAGIASDITQRKQAQEALRESEARFRAIFEQAAVGIVISSLSGQLLKVNQRYCDFLGYSESDLLTLTFQEITYPEDLELDLRYYRQLLAGEIQHYSIEKRYIRKDGRLQWGNLTLSVVLDSDGAISYIMAAIEDIQERKLAEKQLQYRLTLETALAAVSREFATNEAADINQVLTILGVAVGINRAYVTRFRENSTFAYMTHEWCDSQTQPQIQHFQNVDTSLFPWWVEKYRQNENAVISDVEAMPTTAEIEKNLLESLGIRSALAVPVNTASGQLWGTIGFETYRENRKDWSDEDVQLLRVVGEMIYTYWARQQAQEKLRASEALYAGIFNHSAESIFLINVLPDGQFIYQTMNPIHERATGISAAEIAGKTPAEALSPEVAAHVTERYRACLSAGVPIKYEETLALPGGTRIWRTTLIPIRDSTGKIVKLQGSAVDITEEKQAEAEKLRQVQHQQLIASLTLKIRESLQIEEILHTTVTEVKNTLNADRVLFFRLLPEGGGKIVSEAAVANFPSLLGLVVEDRCLPAQYLDKYYQGQIRSCSDIDNVGCTPCYLEFMQQHQIRSNLIVPILVTGESPNGNSKLENSPTVPLSSSPPQKLWGLLCVQQCNEMREWTPLEIALLQQLAERLSIALYQAQLLEKQTDYAQELARSNAELEQFAYVASHDLQAPLGTIASYAQLLEKRYQDKLDDKGHNYINKIVSGAKRMQGLIDDLLLYSRVTRSYKAFELVDCNLVFEEVCANLQASIRKSNAIVTKSELPVVMADRSQMVQLLQNLIGNAIKYRRNQEPPIVSVNVSFQEGAWLFAIRDNGIGIDPKHRERIFQIFQRLHTQKEYSGTGIGLAICQKIVQRHGGRIWVESALGQGSTFYFTIFNKNLLGDRY